MKTYIQLLLFALFTVPGMAGSARAQGSGQNNGLHTWPDSLNIVEVTGTVIIDNSAARPLYFLDEDGDAVADFHLSFGPWWYEPGDGVDRPEAGVTVTISGALQDPVAPIAVNTMLVFDLDGQTWRVPVEYGLIGWNAEPFWFATDDTMTVSGVVFIDTTYYYDHYYLDTDGDTLPEYQLGFGPQWYEPASGATRPAEGDAVDVLGIEHERVGLDLLTVFALDGEIWRSPGDPAPWAGGWMDRDHADSTRAFCMNNRQSWIDFPPDNFGMGMGMGGRNWPDSMFVQFWEIHPDSMPGMFTDRIFSGYHVQIHDRDRIRLMDGSLSGDKGLLRFEKQHHIRLRYYDEDLGELTEESILVWAWDSEREAWTEVGGASINQTENIVTFESTEVASYYALAGDLTGTAVDGPSALPQRMALRQNYPNPFNPRTTIPYALASPQQVTLEVFDLLGRKVAVLFDGMQTAGEHSVVFDAERLPSGVYVYQLKGASQTLRSVLTLTK